jgi:hypothetical protein
MNDIFAYQKLLRELDDKIKLIESTNPTRNSRDSINLIRLRMMRKDAVRRYNEHMGGSLRGLFANVHASGTQSNQPSQLAHSIGFSSFPSTPKI